jgi:hypothetical protein
MLAKFINNAREDSLTASIFSHLLHLPSEVFWSILSNACPSAKFPTYPGEPKSIHAWPNWNSFGTKNTHRVIPDLVIEFHDFDLIIEVKRWDIPMQDKEQWKSEFKAYTNEYGEKKRKVKMIALGGILSSEDKELEHNWQSNDASGRAKGNDSHTFICPVYMCQWSTVLHECECLKRKLKEDNKNNPSSRTYADIRILNDLKALFETHGYAALRWFDDFDFKPYLLDTSVDSYQQFFRNSIFQFQSS